MKKHGFRDTRISVFCTFGQNLKIQNGHHFWQVKYLLKLGKSSLHRYPVGKKIYQNPTSKFLFIFYFNLFICGFNVAFNTVQVISRRVVGRAEETST